jgi:hypothetical protein
MIGTEGLVAVGYMIATNRCGDGAATLLQDRLDDCGAAGS